MLYNSLVKNFYSDHANEYEDANTLLKVVHGHNTFLYRYQYFDNGSFVLVLYNSLVKNFTVIMQMNMKTLILY